MLPCGSERLWSPTTELKDWPVKICGLASSGHAVIGVSYVVELLKPIDGYEYTHAVAFECHLK